MSNSSVHSFWNVGRNEWSSFSSFWDHMKIKAIKMNIMLSTNQIECKSCSAPMKYILKGMWTSWIITNCHSHLACGRLKDAGEPEQELLLVWLVTRERSKQQQYWWIELSGFFLCWILSLPEENWSTRNRSDECKILGTQRSKLGRVRFALYPPCRTGNSWLEANLSPPSRAFGARGFWGSQFPHSPAIYQV